MARFPPQLGAGGQGQSVRTGRRPPRSGAPCRRRQVAAACRHVRSSPVPPRRPGWLWPGQPAWRDSHLVVALVRRQSSAAMSSAPTDVCFAKEQPVAPNGATTHARREHRSCSGLIGDVCASAFRSVTAPHSVIPFHKPVEMEVVPRRPARRARRPKGPRPFTLTPIAQLTEASDASLPVGSPGAVLLL